LRNQHNRKGYGNQERIQEERKKKEREDYQFKLGRTEIESRRMKKPWYLMTHQRETERRMLMKADEVQRSLPRRLKDYNRNTDELLAKVRDRKAVEDPLILMNEYLKKETVSKEHHEDEEDRECKTKRKEKKVVTKEQLKRQRKELLKKIKRDRKEAKRRDKEKRKSSKRSSSKHRSYKRSSKH